MSIDERTNRFVLPVELSAEIAGNNNVKKRLAESHEYTAIKQHFFSVVSLFLIPTYTTDLLQAVSFTGLLKLVIFRLVTSYNLLKQLAETLWITWITGFDNPLATSVLTTCNRHITNKPLHVMQYVCCNGFDYVHYTYHLHHLMSVDPHQLNLHYSCCLEISLKAVGKQKIYNMRCVWVFFLYVFTKIHDM